MSPGRKPRLSPASTAGRTSTILPICFCLSDFDRRGHGQIRFAGAGRPAAEHQVVRANRLDVLGLPGRSRANHPAGLLHIDRRRAAVGRPAGHLLDDVRNLLGRDGAVAADRVLDLLDDLGGLENGLFIAADVNLAVAGRNFGRHRIADAPQMLVARAQQHHQFIGGADRNRRFDHQKTRRHTRPPLWFPGKCAISTTINYTQLLARRTSSRRQLASQPLAGQPIATELPIIRAMPATARSACWTAWLWPLRPHNP